MDPITGAIVGGLITGVGTAYAGYKAADAQEDANKKNMQLSRENREFQERMALQAQDFEAEQAGTAYQRAMVDMRKAGLNPMLAYQQGGAPTPIGKTAPGSVIPMQSVGSGGVGEGLASAVSTSSQLATADVQRDKVRQEIDNLSAQIGLTEQDTERLRAETNRLVSQMENIDAQTSGVEAENVKKEALADFIRQNPNAVIVSEYGGKGVVPLTTILGALGLAHLEDFALKAIDRAKQEAQSLNFNLPGNTRDVNPLTDRY